MAILCSSASPMASCSWLPTKASPLLSSRTSVFFSSGASGLSRRGLSLVSRRRMERSGGGGGLDCRCLFGLGVPELVVIAGVAALVFGPKKLPEVGRSIGKTVKSFQQAAKEFEVELKKGPEDANQSPPAKEPKAVNSEELKKELEAASDTKESV